MVGVFTGANEQLTVMQSLVGGIAIAYGAILTVQKLKAGYDILALAMAKRKNATEKRGLLISISDMQ